MHLPLLMGSGRRGKEEVAGVASWRRDIGSYGPLGTLEGNTALEHNQMGCGCHYTNTHCAAKEAYMCTHSCKINRTCRITSMY